MADRRLEGTGLLVNDVGWDEMEARKPTGYVNPPYILKMHMEIQIGEQTCVANIDGEKATVKLMYPEQLLGVIEHMAWQFGYRSVKNGKAVINTGGLSALEEAFEELGWDDPHEIPEGLLCDVEGCPQSSSGGSPWGLLYLRLCSEHIIACFRREPAPPVKRAAIDREARRDPVTRILAEEVQP